MMVSVVFLRFSGKARSIVVWTTGGSSWCPVVGGEQRQPLAGLWSQHHPQHQCGLAGQLWLFRMGISSHGRHKNHHSYNLPALSPERGPGAAAARGERQRTRSPALSTQRGA